MRFDFSTASRILFGPGTCSEVPSIASSFGQRVLVVTDSLERCGSLHTGLKEKKISVVLFIVNGEPDINQYSNGYTHCTRI